MNSITCFKNGKTRSVIEQARAIGKNLGIRYAAGFLRNKGYSLEGSLFILCGA